MTKLVTKKAGIKFFVEPGLVNEETHLVNNPHIKKQKFAKVVEKLYKAIINESGLYKFVTMATHAPQTKYYPGAEILQKEKILESIQVELFGDHREAHKPSHLTSVVAPGSLLHRRWLWFTTLTDRREVSERVYAAHCKIHAEHPEFYEKEVISIQPEEFWKKLHTGKYKVGSPYQSAGYWLVCAKTLFEEFNGDPVLLLKHAGWGVQAVYDWKKRETKKRGYDPIPGWGRKLISLYFLYLAELGFSLPDDAFPADVHAQAIPLQTDSFDFGDKNNVYSAPFAEIIRKETVQLCKSKGYDVVLVAHASWLLGSQLCTQCSSRVDAQILCPIYNECKGRMDTGSYFAKGIWYKNGPVMTKGGDRPKFGLPTQVSPRFRSRKTTRKVIEIIPLFGDLFSPKKL